MLIQWTHSALTGPIRGDFSLITRKKIKCIPLILFKNLLHISSADGIIWLLRLSTLINFMFIRFVLSANVYLCHAAFVHFGLEWPDFFSRCVAVLLCIRLASVARVSVNFSLFTGFTFIGASSFLPLHRVKRRGVPHSLLSSSYVRLVVFSYDLLGQAWNKHSIKHPHCCSWNSLIKRLKTACKLIGISYTFYSEICSGCILFSLKNRIAWP